MRTTFASLAATLIAAEARMKAEHHAALEKAARLVEAEAKAEIGTYQDAAGPFGAWPELAPSTQAERVALGFTPNDPGLRTGEMRDSIGHTVGEDRAVVGSDDDKLVWFELGTVSQPPRSVLGTAVIHKEKEVVETIGRHVRRAMTGKSVPGGEQQF